MSSPSPLRVVDELDIPHSLLYIPYIQILGG